MLALFLLALVPPLLVGGVLLHGPIVVGVAPLVLAVVATAVAEVVAYHAIRCVRSGRPDPPSRVDVLRERWLRATALVVAVVGVDVVLAFLVVLAVSGSWPAPYQQSTVHCSEVEAADVDGVVVPAVLLPTEQRTAVEEVVDARREYEPIDDDVGFPWTAYVLHEGVRYRCDHYYEQRSHRRGSAASRTERLK